MPPLAYPQDPMNAITSRFVHLSLNKIRCPINAVRWTPDGRRLLTGASSGEFTLWNGTTFNFETIMQAHEAAIRAMNWNHQGSFLVSGDHSGALKIWQPSLNLIKILPPGEAHQEPVRQVTFSPNDSKFASCSDDGSVKIWDFAEAVEERCLSGHGWDVRTVHWHPHKSLLASGSKDNLVKLWDPRTGSSVGTLHGHKNSVLDVKWNRRNGWWLATASKDQIIKIYDLRMIKREMQTFRAHQKEINAVAWHPVHERLLASAGAEGAVHFYLAGLSYGEGVGGGEEPVSSLMGAHDNIVWSLDWHPLGHLMATGSADCSVRFWMRNRPGDNMMDRFTVGRAAADALGLPEPRAASYNPPQQTEPDLELQRSLPGIGSRPAAPPSSASLPGLGAYMGRR